MAYPAVGSKTSRTGSNSLDIIVHVAVAFSAPPAKKPVPRIVDRRHHVTHVIGQLLLRIGRFRCHLGDGGRGDRPPRAPAEAKFADSPGTCRPETFGVYRKKS
jgi:hypothetical protein